MAPPIPTLPTPPALLHARLGDVLAWSLIVTCPCRSYPRSVPLRDVAASHGSRVTVARVLSKLRCSACGAPPTSVQAARGDVLAKRSVKVRLR